MKLLVISDVHSNMKAVEAVATQEKHWDMIVFAGDMVDFGLYPHDVIDWMRKHRVIAVAGNHDMALVDKANSHFQPLRNPTDATTFLEHNLSLLTGEQVEYLSKLPEEAVFKVDGITYYMTHIYDKKDGYALLNHLKEHRSISAFESFWQVKVGNTKGKRCLILGDTHHCMMVQLKKDTLIINPGSLGYNLGEDVQTNGASYMVIEDGIPYFRYAQYNTEEEYQFVKEKMINLNEWQYQTGLAIFKA